MSWKPLLQLLLITILFSRAALALDHSALETNWGYKGSMGPESWSVLSRDFVTCAIGKLQSPINIRRNRVRQIADNLQINYVSAEATLTDNASAVLTIGTQQIAVKNNGTHIKFDNASETINYANATFHLIDIHFHAPSEHQINGGGYPLEIHFVHQDDDGDVVILAVFAKGGEINDELQKIINDFPMQAKSPKIHVDPLQLMPMQKDFFAYPGSLTTPPCTEGVSWIVFANPITVSPQQIVLVRRAVGVSARSIQPLNKRGVTFSRFHSLSFLGKKI